jgi:hypothetical protein
MATSLECSSSPAHEPEPEPEPSSVAFSQEDAQRHDLSQWQDGQRVWAKLKGNPWWEATICPDASGEWCVAGCIHVIFQHTDGQEGYIALESIKDISCDLDTVEAVAAATVAEAKRLVEPQLDEEDWHGLPEEWEKIVEAVRRPPHPHSFL